MVRKILVLLLLINFSMAVFSQEDDLDVPGEKLKLLILPFIGGEEGDGDAIDNLFSSDEEINEAFDIVICTDEVKKLVVAEEFQNSGYADSDTIAGFGSMTDADLVIGGRIFSLSESRFVMASVIDVNTAELLAGKYLEYSSIEDLSLFILDFSSLIIKGYERDTPEMQKLAVIPCIITNPDIEDQNAEILSYALAIDLANTDAWAVFPRAAIINAALQDITFDEEEDTISEEEDSFNEEEDSISEEEDPLREKIIELGKSIEADYALCVFFDIQEDTTQLSSRIYKLNDGSSFAGNPKSYSTFSPALAGIKELANYYATVLEQEPVKVSFKERFRENMLNDPSKNWSLGGSVGSTFATPFVLVTVHGTLAPFRHSFFDIGIDFGFLTNLENNNNEKPGYFSLYPFLHYNFFLPLIENINAYAGIGAGLMVAFYKFDDLSRPVILPAADATVGFLLLEFIDISYTLRTNFYSVNNKVSIGYVKRFR